MKLKENLEINIGIKTSDRKDLAEGLGRLLAETFTLYLKTLNYHWNVTGPMFPTLHVLFEQQYTELALAIDLIAEKIRALGYFAPASYKAYANLSTIKDDDHDVPNAEEMIRSLVEANETIVRTAREFFPIAETAHDQSTCDLFAERMKSHEKTSWMLRSMIVL